jgi:hypothetical protein
MGLYLVLVNIHGNAVLFIKVSSKKELDKERAYSRKKIYFNLMDFLKMIDLMDYVN